jgi:hypothetical protein
MLHLNWTVFCTLPGNVVYLGRDKIEEYFLSESEHPVVVSDADPGVDQT